MRFLRRSVTGLFLTFLTLGLLAWAGYALTASVQARLNQEARPGRAEERVFAVNVVEVTPERITPVLETFGEVRSRRVLELRAATGGKITYLSDAFEEGGSVAEGEVLARIDPTQAQAALDVAEADRHEAEANLRDAERSLEIARDDLESAEAQVGLREATLARQRTIRERGIGSDAQVEEAELTLASARQAVLSKRQAVANAEAAVDQARTGVLRAGIALAEAERGLEETEIRAGFAGTLADVSAVEGGLLTANEQIASLIDPNALEVSFRVSTPQYARLLDADGRLAGADVQVILDAQGMELVATGRVSRESASVSEGETGRLLFARIDDAGGFRPGDFVTVAIEEPPLDDVARVPATAVDAAGTVLVVGEEDRLQLADAPVLRRQGDDVLIPASGLAGELIVAERSPLLGAGIRVRAQRPVPNPDGEAATLAAAEPDSELLELTPERRAALIAFIEGNQRMPAEIKERVLAELAKEKVSARTVQRIEERMGG